MKVRDFVRVLSVKMPVIIDSVNYVSVYENWPEIEADDMEQEIILVRMNDGVLRIMV